MHNYLKRIDPTKKKKFDLLISTNVLFLITMMYSSEFYLEFLAPRVPIHGEQLHVIAHKISCTGLCTCDAAELVSANTKQTKEISPSNSGKESNNEVGTVKTIRDHR